MNVKQTTDTICSVTATPLRGGVAESDDMGSERMSETERKTAKNGIGIFPWNRFSRRDRLVNRAPFYRRRSAGGSACAAAERKQRNAREGRRTALPRISQQLYGPHA
jgi:hypothetical protein